MIDGKIVAIGALLAGGLAWLTRRYALSRLLVFWATGLGIAAALYVVFAVHGDGSHRWLMIEFGGLALFAGLALLALRLSPWLLAVAWLAHVGWDVGLHGTAATGFVPTWYPPLCIGFDLVVAAIILHRLRKRGPTPPISI